MWWETRLLFGLQANFPNRVEIMLINYFNTQKIISDNTYIIYLSCTVTYIYIDSYCDLLKVLLVVLWVSAFMKKLLAKKNWSCFHDWRTHMTLSNVRVTQDTNALIIGCEYVNYFGRIWRPLKVGMLVRNWCLKT